MSDVKEYGRVPAQRWLISGRVQGVAFRWFTTEAAHELSLRGTVRNLADGRVEILVVEGEDPSVLEAFFSRVEAGPSHARVDGIERSAVSAEHAQELGCRRGFDIVY